MKASKTRRFLIPTILCGMALVGIVYYYFFASFSKTDETQYVYIDDDDNADSVYHKLSDIATIHGLNAFTIMARHSGYADHVKTGRYAIKPGEGAFVVFRHIKNGMQTPVSLTIPSVRTIGRLSAELAKHLMLHIDGQTARISDRPRHLVGRMGLDLQEVPVLHRFRTDQCHIIGTGVVVLGIEAGRICEVAVLAAEACRLRIHHVGEGLAGTRHMAGECIAALIRRFQQQRVETVPHRQNVTLFDLGIRRSGVDIVHVIMTEGHLLIEVTVLQYHERGQHLRD